MLRANDMNLPEPLCPVLQSPAKVAPDDAYIIRARLTRSEAQRVAESKIRDSVLRPEDIGSAVIEEPILGYVPFWRAELALDGYHVSIAGRIKVPGMSLPIPLPRKKHGDAVVIVEGRKLFPYPPKLAYKTRISGPLGTSSSTVASWRRLKINPEDWTRRSDEEELDGELVQPDVTREMTERQAKLQAAHGVIPDGAIFADYQPEIRTIACCHVPLFVTRYSYAGHAKPYGGKFWIAICGQSGDVVGAEHPSAAKAIARKIRKLMTF